MEHSTAKWTTMETRRHTGVPTKCVRVVFICGPLSMCPHIYIYVNVHIACVPILYLQRITAVHAIVCV